MAPVMRCSARTPPASRALLSQLRPAISPPSRAFDAAAGSLQSVRLLLGRVQFTEREGHHRKRVGGGGSLQHLYAVIAAVAHDDAALAVDQNAAGPVELPIFTAFAADGSHVAAVTVA
jgi:hypothetical protein